MTQFAVEPPLSIFYGCSFERCARAVSVLPVQVVGSIPCSAPLNRCIPEPCMTLLVFGGGSGEEENDTSYFLFDFPSSSGNDFRLESYSSGVWSDIGAAASYGSLYDFGVWQEYPNRSGIEINWDSVLSAFGPGYYRIKITSAITGDFLASYAFELAAFDCRIAESTIRLDSSITGKVSNYLFDEGAEVQTFDLLSMRWNDQIRLRGKLQVTPSEITETTYTRSSKRVYSHKSSFSSKYRFIVNSVTVDVLKRIESYCFTSNMNITPYSSESQTVRSFIAIRGGQPFEYELFRNNKIPIASTELTGRHQREFENC